MAAFALVTTVGPQPRPARATPGEPGRAAHRQAFASLSAWFKNARFRVTLGISARTLIGPALERVYATPG